MMHIARLTRIRFASPMPGIFEKKDINIIFRQWREVINTTEAETTGHSKLDDRNSVNWQVA